jgi:predicted RNA binding protein YcfA (HicA-like mRNA interferase family)
MKKKGISSRELKRMIEEDGWVLVKITEDHHHFKHPSKKGKVTIQHPVKDLPPWVVNDALKKAGLK